MATSFDAVLDVALTLVDSYKLVKLHSLDIDSFNRYCDGLLISAIPNFTQCRTELAYDRNEREFNSDLSELEISILADYWAMQWAIRAKNVESELHLGININGGVNRHSEAQNLKEKSVDIDKMREKVNQKITEYQLQDISAYNF